MKRTPVRNLPLVPLSRQPVFENRLLRKYGPVFRCSPTPVPHWPGIENPPCCVMIFTVPAIIVPFSFPKSTPSPHPMSGKRNLARSDKLSMDLFVACDANSVLPPYCHAPPFSPPVCSVASVPPANSIVGFRRTFAPVHSFVLRSYDIPSFH